MFKKSTFENLLPASQPYGTEIRKIHHNLFFKIKKRIKPFGILGFIVGCLIIFCDFMKEKGIFHGENWGNAIFSDYISPNVWWFIAMFLPIISSSGVILTKIGLKFPCISDLASCLESIFIEISSDTIAFLLGISSFALCHSIVSMSIDGLIFALKCVAIITWIFFTSPIPLYVSRKIAPYNHWKGALFAITVTIASSIFDMCN